MKETSKTARNGDRKKKVIATTAMLLVAATVLIAVSYAWLVLSIAPEVSGISTQIGANGALEIVLLNRETHDDLTKISSGIGITGNNTWRNIVELGAEEYGLANITLYPARLNITGDAENGYKLKNGSYLSVPEYDYTGVVTRLTDDTYGLTYNSEKKEFAGNISDPGYGVRGFGKGGGLSVRDAALALAQSNVSTYSGRAKSEASSTLGGYTDDLLSLLMAHSTDNAKVYNDAEIECLGKILVGLEESYSYIDMSIRQGMIAYAASTQESDTQFEAIKNIIDSSDSLASLNSYSLGSAEFQNFMKKAIALGNYINSAKVTLSELKQNKSGAYLWSDIRPIMDSIINVNNIYLGDKRFSEISKEELLALAGKSFDLSLPEGSGAFADIADFTGNYYTNVAAMGSSIKVETLSTLKTSYLSALSNIVKNLDVSSNTGSGEIILSNVYGYAIDLGFRTNAPLSDLLLQTGAISRISQDDPDDNVPGSGASTMGAGSFMEFTTDSKTFTPEQMTALMDAIRVAFIDSKDNVLGIAKLNTSNRTIVDGVVKAPLYLYEYSLVKDEEAGGNILKMGARRGKDDNVITPLQQNVAMAVTALVWLDGDIVNNTMVATDSSTSLNGVLNLQFSSSADLVPADIEYLKNLSPDKNALSQKIEESKLVYEAGQGMYSTESWDDFSNAYNYAVKIYENNTSTEAQVLKAQKNLASAKEKLVLLTIESLRKEVNDLRSFMGRTDKIARAIIEENGSLKVVSYYDRETEISGNIYHVDDANNLTNTAESGVMIPKYTEASWNALAQVLYEAEALCLLPSYANGANIDAAISAIEDARETLIPYFTKTAYTLDDVTYYRADVESDDNYGLWYDENLNVVTSDITILKLEAKSESVKMANISGINNYLPLKENDAITELYPSIDFTYPDGISEEDIIAIQWKISTGNYILAMTASQEALLTKLISDSKALGVTVEATEAEKVLNAEQRPSVVTASATINALKNVYDRYAHLNKLVEKANELRIYYSKITFDDAHALLTPNNNSKESTLEAVNAEIEILADQIHYAIKVKTQKLILAGLIDTATDLDLDVSETKKSIDDPTVELDAINDGIAIVRNLIHLEYRKITLSNFIDRARAVGKTEEANAASQFLGGESPSLSDINAEIAKLEEVIPGDESYLIAVEPAEEEVKIDDADIEFTQVILPGDFTYADLIFMEDNQILYLYQPIEEDESGEAGESTTPDEATTPEQETGDASGESEKKPIDYTGNITLTAVVLTKDGYVCTIEKVITIYKPAQIKEPINEHISVNTGSSKVAEVELVNDPEFKVGERIREYVWASEDLEIANISPYNSTCAIKGVKAGTTTVRVTVYTMEGNEYTKTFIVTVQ